jgi:hypothetical protein
MQLASLGQQPGQRREHRSIRPRQAGAADLATQHCHLMPQHQNLRVFRSRATGQPEPGHHLPEDEIEQSNRHGLRSCLTATTQQHRRSRPWMTSSAPTGADHPSQTRPGPPNTVRALNDANPALRLHPQRRGTVGSDSRSIWRSGRSSPNSHAEGKDGHPGADLGIVGDAAGVRPATSRL